MTRDGSVDVSVVIGFKDWGVERLRLAVESLMGSFGSLRGEVIVSDYGSTACPEVADLVSALGARHVYTETDGTWSRSRALNAGFAVSSGRVLVSTDADMLFSPHAMETIGQALLDDPGQALVLQCRNLPEGMGSDYVAEHGMQWAEFEARAALRPRWGMGGMMAVAREAFLDVRGFDERMKVYGGEDLDFAQRIRRTGRRIRWVSHPEVRMFHMWHPSSRDEASQTPEGLAAIEFNRTIYLQDTSFVRNTTHWEHRPPDAPPAASIVIATRNRAALLRESVHSALSQTVQDVEVIVVVDGSTDDTLAVLDEIDDPRLRYFTTPGRGIPACRNLAAAESRAPWTVVHDDDDLMMPDRVERHLAALQAGDSGTYGAWVDFDDRDGSVVAINRGKSFTLASLMFTSRVLAHGTLMLRTDLIRRLRYDERFQTGSDYNLAMRMSRMGVRLRHTGHVHTVRRLHDGQVTAVSAQQQQSAGRWSSVAALAVAPPERHPRLRAEAGELPDHDLGAADAGVEASIVPFLPDSLVRRDVHVTVPQTVPGVSTDGLTELVEVTERIGGQDRTSTCGVLRSASWEDLARWRRRGARLRVLCAHRAFEDAADASNGSPFAAADHADQLAKQLQNHHPGVSAALVSGVGLSASDEAPGTLGRWHIDGHDFIMLALPLGQVRVDDVSAAGGQVRLMAPTTLPADRGARTGAPASPRPSTPGQSSPAQQGLTAGGGGNGKARVSTGGGTTGRRKRANAAHAGGNGARGTSGGAKPGRPGREPSGPTGARANGAVRAGGSDPRTRSATRTPAPVPRAGTASSGVSLLRATVRTTKRRLAVAAALVLGVLLSMSAGALAGGTTGLLLGLLVGLAMPWLAGMTLLALVVAARTSSQLAGVHEAQRAGRQALARQVLASGARTRRAIRGDLARQLRRADARERKRTRRSQRRGLAQVLAALTRQASETSRAQEAQADEVRRLVAELTEQVLGAVVRQGAELSRSQEARADELRELIERRTDQLASRSDELQSSLQHLTAQGGKIGQRAEAALTNHLRQSQALLSLHGLVDVRAGAPILGGWAASPDVMLWLADELLAKRPKLVVECGSGASTVWLALLIREFGLATRVVALEHEEVFAAATREQLAQHGLSDLAEVRLAPLRTLGPPFEQTSPWYDMSAVDDLSDIGLLFVDGPPGTLGPEARLPAMPVLKDRLAENCAVVLDDARRVDEKVTAQRWRELAPDFHFEELDLEKGAVLLRRGA